MLQYIVYTHTDTKMDSFNCSSTFTKTEMGSPHKDPNVFHFTHPHPLECTTSPSTPNILHCFGCKLKLKPAEDYYHCKTCAFSLHHVCYNMPLITNHPSHPTHPLNLLLIPSTKPTPNCAACGHHVTGFSYHCAQCTIFFHAFCLALPLSLAITYHPHKIKLQFSPPYDFFCDLCNKPSNHNNRWLYRCNMCEFDTHIACAVENLDPRLFHIPSFPQSSPLLRQLTSHQVEHKKISASVGDSFKGYEYGIMSLVAQQIGGGTRENFDSTTAGWDKRLYSSPRKKHNRAESEKMKNVELGFQEKALSPAEVLSELEGRTPLRDKWTPLSDHSDAPFSNQYSDSCFSIDLAKSYSSHARRSQVQKEGGKDQITRAATMPETPNVGSNCAQREEPFVVVNNTLNAAIFIKEGRTSDAGKSSQRVMMKNRNERHAKSSVQDETIAISETGRTSCSCWKKFLNFCPLA
uniref:DC1 domain-containing protein n=2 Tax=Phaseolus vulgaris TaxID=3885 RepID=V7CW33_PHAVU|nr:hypothetical protein PHAVU_001G142900g [Phaseolus vulgaris]ESW34324.1 hypothetical protein PHAVU_001G142900g [Phaseolus vulgaris]